MLIPLKTPEILTTPYYFSAAWDGLLNVRETPGMPLLPQALRAATLNRRSEFLAGRFCAAKAIQALRPDWSGEIGINPDGSPIWPGGLVGSITHTQGFAAAAIATKEICLSIGIDSERAEEAGVLAAAKEIAISADERRLSARLPVSADEFTLLVFSAKESIYKCLYPLVKRPLDFSDVALDDIDFQNRRFNFHLSKSSEPGLLKSGGARGRFSFAHGCVHTGVELKA